MAAALFLLRNGLRRVADNVELEQFTLRGLADRSPLSEITGWFRANVKALG